MVPHNSGDEKQFIQVVKTQQLYDFSLDNMCCWPNTSSSEMVQNNF